MRSHSNRGELDPKTLTESLAVDFAALMRATFPKLSRSSTMTMRTVANESVTQRMATAGQLLFDHFGAAGYLRLARHRSDVVRSWAAFLLAASPDFSMGERLQLTRPLANDHHSEVREWAWLALRPHVLANVELAIDLLEAWTVSTSPFLRRFSVEATRPRGVWSEYSEVLMKSPELGLPILEPLRSDPHQYVQDSVSNWLNDASWSQPAFVRELCARWREESSAPATERICRRALRSID
ncbi:MAG TPA: DNA alkylation repair protein [Chthoniobacteraceae bacterium]|nr:DNA alkylation repair protein [Chthoniobacteraceae bacterium]